MKEVYLVRHGETTSNLTRTWRTPDEQLTEKGLAQAEVVAERVKTLPIERMVVSTSSRTMTTAKIISDATGLPFEGDQLFYEEKTPSSIMGLLHEKTPDNPIEQYIEAALAHAEDPDFRYENEENLYERKMRIGHIFDFLEEHADGKLLIVTHGNILKMMAAHIILGSDCSAKELYLASQRLRTTNTGISKFFKEDDGEWRILIWNDHAHFAE